VIILFILVFLAEKYRLIVGLDKNGNFMRQSHDILTRFTTFFLGSIIAVLVNLIQNVKLYKKISGRNLFRLILGIISIALYVKGMHKYSKFYNKDLHAERDFFESSLYWSVFLFAFIIGGQNFFTNIFKLGLFSYGGKFSYGIYLYHMMVIDYFNRNYRSQVQLQFEFIIYCFIGAFLIGMLTYYVIDKNLIRLANYICSKI
jgi:peptidoglycan/LPS O-acetylase OafA/YrhL